VLDRPQGRSCLGRLIQLAAFPQLSLQRITTVVFPNPALSKIGFNLKREMLRRRALLCLTERLTDMEKCLRSRAINRATRTSLNEINPYRFNHTFVEHFRGLFSSDVGRGLKKSLGVCVGDLLWGFLQDLLNFAKYLRIVGRRESVDFTSLLLQGKFSLKREMAIL
jgi:hypothetical protein